jgi:hypothetical protein
VAISKANFNSFNVTPTASKFITFNSSNNGLAADDVGGNLKLISTQTASSSATIDFTSGIDSTYKEYIFKYINIHPANDGQYFQVNFRDGGSSFDSTKTTTAFEAYHNEAGSAQTLQYLDGEDLAQSTSFQNLTTIDNDNDATGSGTLHLFDPSNTTFVKHFLANINCFDNNVCKLTHIAGYCNTTSAIDGAQFKMASGNIDSGVIKLYGVS